MEGGGQIRKGGAVVSEQGGGRGGKAEVAMGGGGKAWILHKELVRRHKPDAVSGGGGGVRGFVMNCYIVFYSV